VRDEWLYTGDLMTRDGDGYLWFNGRLKQIIVRGGSNIAPQEVEEALLQHPAVLETGVIGMPDPLYGQSVAAFVSLRRGVSVTEGELREFARDRLADYKLPEKIWFLPDLPKGLTGKLDRRALAEIASSQPHAALQSLEARG
jgi:long-chain acyl-CoA synthetase